VATPPPVRSLAGAALALSLIACARIGAPPGGPPDKLPPQLISTHPDSLIVDPDWKGDVELQFNETLTEGGTPSLGSGTSDLERLILLSPSDNVPRVGWHRSRLSIRPKEGWKPNRVYRVQLLPGVQDIRNNKADTSIVITFTTGAPVPTTTLSGRVIDWMSRKLAAGTLVEAVLEPDSLPYRALTDTSGRFQIGPLPAGHYLVFAVTDQNRNRRRESRELFDSVRVDSGGSTVAPLWIQPHDTLAPRIQSITPLDSVSAVVQFTAPLDPYAPPPFASLRLVLLPDSTPVEGATLLGRIEDSTLRARLKAEADSLAALSDSTKRKPAEVAPPKPVPPKPKPAPTARPSTLRPVTEHPAPDTTGLGALLASRPPLDDKLVLRVPGRLEPNAKYSLEIQALRGLNSAPGSARGGLIVPAPTPVKVDTTQTRTDSLTGKPDSVRADSSTRKPGPHR
jgi:hypothetical protein